MVKELGIVLNDTCNLACKYCFYVDGRFARKNEMVDISKIENFLRDLMPNLKENRLESIILTGGEPFLFPELSQLVAIISKYCRHICIYTNGTLLQKADMDWILAYDVTLHISVDRLNEAYIEKHRGGYNKLMSTLNLLQEYQYTKLYFSTVLTPFNIYQMDELQQHANDYNAQIELSLAHTIHANEYHFTTDTIVNKYPVHKIFRSFFGKDNDIHWKFLQFLLNGNKLRSCPLSRIRMIIDCDGMIYPCFYVKHVLGSYEDDAQSILVHIEQYNQENPICQYTELCCFNII